MRGISGLAAGRPLLAVLVLVLLPGSMLGYFGLSGLAEREDAMRASYAATAALVRDRLADHLTRLESALPSPRNPAELRRLQSTNAWLDHPFRVGSGGCIMTVALTAGCAAAQDPLADSPVFAARVAAAEAAEFERGDLNAALAQYREAIAVVHGSATSARLFALSRIARTLFKLKRPGEASAAYQSLIDESDGVLDRNGLPYAVIGLVQLAALGETVDRKRAVEAQLLRFMVDRPWDLDNGYREYLARGRSAATDTALVNRVDALQAEATEIDWIRDAVTTWRSAQSGSAALPAAQLTHVATVRAGRPVLVGLRRGTAGLGTADILGYEIRPESLGGTMMIDALKEVSLGSTMRVALVTPLHQTAHPLAEPAVLPEVPGWNVALFDREGRSIEQLVRRERWTYGALVIGMLAVMAMGIVVASRVSVRATELARLQTEFVSNVSHELKTPLALIRMFGETLESGVVIDSATRQEFYGIIRRESERLTQLINNVLDIGRIDRGMKGYNLRQEDLVEVVRAALDAYRPLFNRLSFRVEAALSDSPVPVLMDPEAITQALVNMFQNVITYSAAARFVGVVVGIRGGDAWVSVTDQGVGISREHLTRIFDRYYRVPDAASATASTHGSGLGLAIVKHAMDAHRGRVDIESVVGKGSVFTLVFPLETDNAPDVARRRGYERARA